MRNASMRLAALIVIATGSGATAAPSSREQANMTRIAAVRAYLQSVSGDMSSEERRSARFAVAFVDLNGDGVEEALVYGPADRRCGTGGCGTSVLVSRGSKYRLKCSTTIGWPPVSVLPTKRYGWRDIAVLVPGGGITPGYRAVLSFNGSRYPLNPSVPPANPMKGKTSEEVLIDGAWPEKGWAKLYP